MRYATTSVLLVFLLGASTAAAQAEDEDDNEGQAPTEGSADGPPAGSSEDDSEDEEEGAGDLGQPSTLEEGDLEEQPEPEEEEEEAPAHAAAGAELPWRNTYFSWTHQVTFNSFIRDSQLTYDPLYVQSFAISPRWYVGPQSFFLVNQSLQIELTDSDGDALNRDPQVGDTLIDFRQIIPWEGFVFQLQPRVILPLSKASLAAQRYFSLGLGLQVIRVIPEINLTLAGLVRYGYWFAGSNVVQIGEPQPDRCSPPPTSPTGDLSSPPELGSVMCDQVGGASALQHSILSGMSATLTFGDVSISTSFFFWNGYGYELAPAYVQVDTREEPLMIADGSRSHWRNGTYFSLAVSHQTTSWLNLSLGIQNHHVLASAWNPDGSVRNPIFTPDTQVFLSATVQLDTVYEELFGVEEEELSPEERQRRLQGLASGPSVGGAF